MKWNKIIFLDIDGVLNSIHYSKNNDDLNLLFNMEIDPIPLALLKTLINTQSDIKLVISSSWRDSVNLSQFQQIFSPYESSIIDLTSNDHSKSDAIELWLTKNPTKEFIILDDDILFDLNHPFSKNQIKTTMMYGLTNEIINQIKIYFKIE